MFPGSVSAEIHSRTEASAHFRLTLWASAFQACCTNHAFAVRKRATSASGAHQATLCLVLQWQGRAGGGDWAKSSVLRLYRPNPNTGSAITYFATLSRPLPSLEFCPSICNRRKSFPLTRIY